MKKVLLLTYYWPPAGGAGVQRWLKFTQFLPENNIHPVVYTPKNPNYPLIDESIEKEVPQKNITVIKRPIFEPYKLASVITKSKKVDTISSGVVKDPTKRSWKEKLLLYIRGNFFIPDARKYWIKPSVKFLTSYLQENNIDTVISTGPPHTMHVIGLRLKEELDIRWIADFRDPWKTVHFNDFYFTKRSLKKHQDLEDQVLSKADHILTTTFQLKKEYESITSTPVSTITNGFTNFENITVSPDQKFSFAHIGSLISGRNPKILWEALHEIIESTPSFKSVFELKLIGNAGNEVKEDLQKFQLIEYTKFINYVPHAEAVRYQREVQVLLLLGANTKETVATIPGKLFEYLNAHRPLLSFGPKNWDANKIIETTNSGYCFNYSTEEKERVKTVILELFNKYKSTGSLTAESEGIEQYSVQNLTKELTEIIHNKKGT